MDSNPIKSVDLTSNPTFRSSELVMQSNTLEFGLYQFIFQIDVVSSKLYNVTNSASTFIQIIPTGLAIFGLQVSHFLKKILILTNDIKNRDRFEWNIIFFFFELKIFYI